MFFNDFLENSVGEQQSVGEGEVGDRTCSSPLTKPACDGSALITVAICREQHVCKQNKHCDSS